MPLAMNRDVFITCAVTGSVHTPSMSPHLPYTPEDIAAMQETINILMCGRVTP